MEIKAELYQLRLEGKLLHPDIQISNEKINYFHTYLRNGLTGHGIQTDFDIEKERKVRRKCDEIADKLYELYNLII